MPIHPSIAGKSELVYRNPCAVNGCSSRTVVKGWRICVTHCLQVDPVFHYVMALCETPDEREVIIQDAIAYLDEMYQRVDGWSLVTSANVPNHHKRAWRRRCLFSAENQTNPLSSTARSS